MATMILGDVTVSGANGYAQEIATSAHEIKADEPTTRGGTNTGPSPFELMLSGLGACTAITLRMYSDRKQWNLGTIQVKLRFLKEGDDQRIERTISFSGPLDDGQRERLREMADKTPVSKALASGIAIHTSIDAGS